MNNITKQQILSNEVNTLLDKCEELDRNKKVLIKEVCVKLKEIQTLNNMERLV
jgi:hypothetical protein